MDEDQIVDEPHVEHELVDDGMGGFAVQEPEPDAVQEDGTVDWDRFGPGVAELAEKKGWKSIEDMANGYKGAERELTRRAQQQARQPEQEYQEPRQPQQQRGGQQAPVDFEALVDAADGDPALALALYDQHVAGPRLQSMLQEALGNFEQTKLAPLSQVTGSMYWKNEANALRETYGEDFDRYSDEVMDMIEADPSLVERPDGMEIAYHRVMGRHYAADRARSRATQLNTGSRGGGRPSQSNVDPAQAMRDAIRGATGLGVRDTNIG